jgi:uncharacterized protein (TIGR00369 family)
MPNEEHFRKLERMYTQAPINTYFRPSLHIEEGKAELIIPMREELFHVAGAAHGAVYFKALDDVTFFAANSLVDDVFLLTVSFNLYFLRPISGGEMRASGWVISQSRRLFIAEGEISNSNGQLIARGSGTFMRSNIPLTPEVGYQ